MKMMAPKQRQTILKSATLIGVIALTIFLISVRDQLEILKSLGYPGIFVLSILANATIIIPLPGVILTSAMGAVFHPFWVAIATGSGAAIGEVTGFLTGSSGRGVIDNVHNYEPMMFWMKKYGFIAVFILAFIPNPAFDLAGLSAGALKMPFSKFFISCWFGKILKMLVFAYTGAAMLPAIWHLFQ